MSSTLSAPSASPLSASSTLYQRIAKLSAAMTFKNSPRQSFGLRTCLTQGFLSCVWRNENGKESVCVTHVEERDALSNWVEGHVEVGALSVIFRAAGFLPLEFNGRQSEIHRYSLHHARFIRSIKGSSDAAVQCHRPESIVAVRARVHSESAALGGDVTAPANQCNAETETETER